MHIRTTFLSCKPLLILRWNKSDRCTVRNPYVTKPNKSWRNWRKNLAKLEEDTLGAPATMLVNLFSFSQLILKIYAWAVPKKALLWRKHWNLAEILAVKVEIPLFTPFVLPTHFHQQVGRGTWLGLRRPEAPRPLVRGHKSSRRGLAPTTKQHLLDFLSTTN